jgi:hypothetical protein
LTNATHVAHTNSFAVGQVSLLAREIPAALNDARSPDNTLTHQIKIANQVSHEAAAFLGLETLQQLDGFHLIEAVYADAVAFGVLSSVVHRSRKVVPPASDRRLHFPGVRLFRAFHSEVGLTDARRLRLPVR